MLQVGGLWDSLKTMFGFSSPDMSTMFKGGNNGSFYNYFSPSNLDYPWSCVCDGNLYKEFEAKQRLTVPCRNQVDRSMQGVQALCNTELHSMNNNARGLLAHVAVPWALPFLVVLYHHLVAQPHV